MLQIFHLDTITPTPWKNGGGSTRELASWPPGAGTAGFDWRVSVATIAAAGPFSAFPGVDRTIMLLEGDGVQLRSEDGAIDQRLDSALAPFAFSGDVPLHCQLLGGVSTDLNLMVRRDRVRGQLRLYREPAASPASAGGLLLAWRGNWTVQRGGVENRLAPRQGLWWSDEPFSPQLHHDGTPGACLVGVHIAGRVAA
ncbi:HutD family protein [Bordetella sp. BOR01]|uniref:HutD/Ves family protein n=1 Tax=Bordetella sp. BOR01 TaxID=2854779 RepID=UPI001C43A43A|nr:HutD family protein [Bordetella sp. BOR01]MBV7482122.1 HutD family protein [Bordetella sp. BOR01]